MTRILQVVALIALFGGAIYLGDLIDRTAFFRYTTTVAQPVGWIIAVTIGVGITASTLLLFRSASPTWLSRLLLGLHVAVMTGSAVIWLGGWLVFIGRR